MNTRPSLRAAVLAFLCLSLTGFAEPSAEDLQLAYRMQRAVLQTQDLAEIQSVLKLGFNVDSSIGCGDFSAVNGAVGIGNVAMLELLLKAGAKPRSLDDAAFHVNEAKALAMTKALLDAGANANQKFYYMGDPVKNPVPMTTALHRAAYRGHVKVVALLLQQPGVEVDVINMGGSSALMTAVEKGHEPVIRALLAKGANPWLTNRHGRSAIDVAQEEIRKREATLRMLADAPSAVKEPLAGTAQR